MKKLFLTAAALLAAFFVAQAQTDIVTDVLDEVISDVIEDAIDEALDEEEFFYDDEFEPLLGQGLGVYGGHYYLTGFSTLRSSGNKPNYNDKFHFGIKYTLFDAGSVSLLAKYEQTSFWETYQSGYPISESIYNPGIELGIAPSPTLKFVAAAEIKTNGGGEENGRSLNYFRLAMYRDFPLRGGALISAAVQSYLGFAYVQDDRSMENLYRYNGYFTAGAWFQSADEAYKIRVTASPYDHFRHCGVQVDIHYRPYYTLFDNVYYLIQYGYGLEQMQQFAPRGTDLQPQHYLRIGLSICPEFTL